MLFATVMALALQAPKIPPACEGLIRNFYENEDSFNLAHSVNASLLAAEMKFAAATGNQTGVYKQQIDSESLDERARLQGDRLLNLLSAQKCPLPDHITNPVTFQRDRQTCEAAKGTPQQTDACDYIERAVRRTMSPSGAPIR